ncbi:MAG TPA: antibiotic biosynthesis monooxygenase [Nocardioidaceae bacterium]
MYARSTTIFGDPSAAEEGIAFVRDHVWPTVRDMDGCLGLSLLVDRESGRSITTTSWQSEAAMHASGDNVGSLREQGATLVGANQPLVEEWEIVSMHRAHPAEPGTWVRVAWSRVSPAQVEPTLAFYRDYMLPHIEHLDGFASASLMVNRAAGRGVVSVAYDSRDAMERTRDQADYMRARTTSEANVEFLDVAELELAIAHLHVPELV